MATTKKFQIRIPRDVQEAIKASGEKPTAYLNRAARERMERDRYGRSKADEVGATVMERARHSSELLAATLVDDEADGGDITITHKGSIRRHRFGDGSSMVHDSRTGRWEPARGDDCWCGIDLAVVDPDCSGH